MIEESVKVLSTLIRDISIASTLEEARKAAKLAERYFREDKSGIDSIAKPPTYKTTNIVELWDAFSCKTGKNKIVLVHIPKGEHIKLYDCDPEVVDHQLVGIKWHTLGATYVGFVDKDKIEKV